MALLARRLLWDLTWNMPLLLWARVTFPQITLVLCHQELLCFSLLCTDKHISWHRKSSVSSWAYTSSILRRAVCSLWFQRPRLQPAKMALDHSLPDTRYLSLYKSCSQQANTGSKIYLIWNYQWKDHGTKWHLRQNPSEHWDKYKNTPIPIRKWTLGEKRRIPSATKVY